MRRLIFNSLFCLVLVLVPAVSYSCKPSEPTPTVPAVGTLTAYYATESFDAPMGYPIKKGQLICDSNDPLNRIVEGDANNYKYEGDDGGELYSYMIPKSKVEKKTFTMSQLRYTDVGDRAMFVSEKGRKACIFWSKANGHQYFNWDGSEENLPAQDMLNECYVLSAEIGTEEPVLFEEQLCERRGCIELYWENRFAMGSTDPNYCRYREGKIGFIEENWCNAEGWEESKSAWNDKGELLVDQWQIADIADYISIAYIADLNALYINGDLYYKK